MKDKLLKNLAMNQTIANNLDRSPSELMMLHELRKMVSSLETMGMDRSTARWTIIELLERIK